MRANFQSFSRLVEDFPLKRNKESERYSNQEVTLSSASFALDKERFLISCDVFVNFFIVDVSSYDTEAM